MTNVLNRKSYLRVLSYVKGSTVTFYFRVGNKFAFGIESRICDPRLAECLGVQKNKRPYGALTCIWRTEGDSNPRYACDVYTLSRRAPSTARPPVRGELSDVAWQQRHHLKISRSF